MAGGGGGRGRACPGAPARPAEAFARAPPTVVPPSATESVQATLGFVFRAPESSQFLPCSLVLPPSPPPPLLSPTYAHAPCPTTPQLNGSTLIPGIVMDYSPARRQRMLFSGRGRCFPKTDFLIFYHVGALFPAEPDEDKHRRPLKAWEFLQAVSSWLSSFLSLSFAGRRREKRSGLSCPVSRKDPRRHLGAFFSPAALEVAVLHIGAL